MKGRSFQDETYDSYCFGFNGKENDTDFGNKQLVQDYGFRIYNPALGKFLSVDPLTKSYPWYTPYQFAGNKLIWAVDLDGLEERYYTLIFDNYGTAHLRLDTEESTWFLPDLHKVFVPDLKISYTFSAFSVDGNRFDDYNKFMADPIAAIESGDFKTDQQIMGSAIKDMLKNFILRKNA